MLKGLLAEPERFNDFSDLAGWSKVFQNCAGVAIFLGLVKIFKYISFNKTMSQLSGTLTRVSRNLINGLKILKYCMIFQYQLIVENANSNRFFSELARPRSLLYHVFHSILFLRPICLSHIWHTHGSLQYSSFLYLHTISYGSWRL